MLVAVQCPCQDCISRQCSKIPPYTIYSAPDDHFAAGPDCRMRSPGLDAVCWWCPTVGAGIVSPAGVSVERCSTVRPRRSFHCRSTLRYERLGQSGALVVLVAVQLSVLGIISPAGVQISIGLHRYIRPRRSSHCRSRLLCASSGIGRIGGAGCCPTVGAGIVSPASVQNR